VYIVWHGDKQNNLAYLSSTKVDNVLKYSSLEGVR
jgi:hypothetical protein